MKELYSKLSYFDELESNSLKYDTFEEIFKEDSERKEVIEKDSILWRASEWGVSYLAMGNITKMLQAPRLTICPDIILFFEPRINSLALRIIKINFYLEINEFL